MRKLLICTLLLLCGAATTIAAPKVKVQPRWSYFATGENSPEIIIAAPADMLGQKPSATIGTRAVALTPAKEEATYHTYTIAEKELSQGDNTIKVTFADSTYNVPMSLLPQKWNGVQIDYLTGVVHTGGMPLMPSGFYCYSPVQPTIAESEVVRGQNMMSPYQNIDGPKSRKDRIAYLDRAAQLGMKVNYNLLSIAGGGGGAKAAAADASKKMEFLRDEIRALKDHPAIMSWYIADEPDGQGIEPETLEEIYGEIRAIDPYHPISVVIMSAGPGRRFAASCDIIMADTYPVPNSPAAEVVDVIRGLQDELRHEKAIWYVPQTFGGAEWWPREPTPAEIRMMTWGATLEGARGFQAFIRHTPNAFPKNPAMWEAYTQTCREVQQLLPMLDRGVEQRLTVTGYKGVQARSYTLGNEKVVVLLNSSPEASPYKIVLPEPINATAYNMTDNSRVRVINGTIDGHARGFEATAFKIFTDSIAERAFLGAGDVVNPSNMLRDPSFEWEYTLSGGVPASVYGGVGADRGATYSIDSRTAYHGSNSLRMMTPAQGQGCGISFYPLPHQIGKSYILTIWAKADPESLRNQPKGKKMTFTVSLGGFASEEFELTDHWKCYELSATYDAAVSDVRALTSSLRLNGAGTAWFDLLQIVPDMDFTVSPIPGKQAFSVTMNNHIEGGQVRYTLDGSEPSATSELYTTPLTIESVKVVKARVFTPAKSYGITEQQVAAHKAMGAPVTLTTPYTKYSGGGNGALTDGRVAALRYTDPAWQGFIDSDMELVIDLGRSTPVNRITSQYFHSRGDWIMPPSAVEYFVSDDGQNFSSVGRVELGIPEDKPAHKVPATLDGIGKSARYIKVVATAQRKMPKWHSPNDDAWLFADEVIVE